MYANVSLVALPRGSYWCLSRLPLLCCNCFQGGDLLVFKLELRQHSKVWFPYIIQGSNICVTLRKDIEDNCFSASRWPDQRWQRGQHWLLSVTRGCILMLQGVLFLIVCRAKCKPTVNASRQEAQEGQIYHVGKGESHAAMFHSEGLLFATGIREGARCKNEGWFWQGGKEDYFILT